MRKWLVFLVFAAVGLAAVPGTSEARGRRCCRPAPCYCPPVVLPCYGPAWAPCYGPPPFVTAWPPCSGPPQFGPAWPSGYVPAQAPSARSVTIKGRAYQIFPLGDQGVYDREELEGPAPAVARTANIPESDVFNGKARRVAKTIIFNGQEESFNSIAGLFSTLPESDHMIGLHIGNEPDVKRVAEEKRNVRVNAFIYAFRKEDDNDYHVILGDAPGTPNPQYLNVEVSGIPVGGTDENRNQLWEVRKTFKEAFGLGDEGPNSYHRPHPPVPVQVTGSLFWDSEHEHPQTVGPNDVKPKTAWEIHPISRMVFLD
jgi:hypothetical protein